jgi:hypothetical protein
LTIRGDGRPRISVSGIGWTCLKEALGDRLKDFNVLRVTVYPMPHKKIRQLFERSWPRPASR